MLKRLSKGVLLICLLLPMLCAFISHASAEEGPTGENVEIVLHKRVLRDADLSEFTPHQNDGHEANSESDILAKTTALDGAIFDVYDITQLYQESLQTENALLDQLNELSCQFVIDYLQKHGDQPILQGLKTNSEAEDGGILRFNVPKYNRTLNTSAAYLIVETGVDPSAGVAVDLNQARPLAVVLPILDPTTGQEMDTIHLYPKNISRLCSPYFFKIGKKQDGSEVPLAGVSFVLYRKDEAGNRQYLDARATTNLSERWKGTSDPKTDTTLSRFISNETGLVELSGVYLSAGTYYLEEIQSVEGYTMSEKEIPVVIPEVSTDVEGNPTTVTINGQLMADRGADGAVTTEAVEKKEPRVYNQEEKKPDPKPSLPNTEGKGTPSTTPETLASKVLPKTGEQLSLWLTILGVLLVGTVVLYRKQRAHENE
ncbi:peptidase [Enterococcus florum]|uniref:Peptidase n=1 Tax=Enterococcus florum TaxID=2480627 RepID=A0A4P5PC71_9ENTE|nr:pilin N-terminal domain-containing protein [Enterococcus florum]GCF95825.1 peptidase [Enterococcus florum]